ncbi:MULTISPECIES: sensor histidine kinase [unclassified Oceanispirochaeta]|uniref:sensor histidine kinase n=1 Tax=unclassified Oceanispirochaeta TaxID=2635722 RepID=UPI000E08EDB3|nr:MULTISPECIES: histidine kinase [unclassified Oceanispirochaeta]MBF9018920.1 histidine kinase [Oceanispirochaeta sp. M2]NPD75419.1 histidine kinase [Oceanispirochaeta sp. M1]RDG28731.1 hypothetical protein DV872_25335 [Oceanispirochaeta sp. M1]
MHKKGFRYSVSVKLSSVFVLAVIILFSIGFSIYNWGINKVRTDIINAECIQNRHYSANLNREFKRITMLQYDLVNNRDLIKVSTLENVYGNYDTYQMVLRIEDKILAIKNSSNIIDDIDVIVPLIDKSISTGTTGRISSESQNLISNYGDRENKQIIFENNSILLISEFPQHYYLIDIPPYFLIHATISMDTMVDFLNDMSMTADSSGFISSESRDMLIFDEQDENIVLTINESIKEGRGQEIYSEHDSPRTVQFTQELGGKKYLVIYTRTGLADMHLVRYAQESIVFSGFTRYKIIIWIFGLTSLFLTLLFSNSLHNMIHEPLNKLIGAFERLQRFDFPVSIEHNRDDEFKYIYESFDEMSFKLEQLIDQVYKQKILMEKSKLKQLQSQINPHFLYNSFLLLRNRIQTEDIDFASEFCDDLGAYFMYITRNKDDVVSLKDEITHTISYSKIQYARFKSRMTMDIEPLLPEYENILVPRIIFQPIIENAFEHAIEKMNSGGILRLGYCAKDEYLDVLIEDNGEISDRQIIKLQKYLTTSDHEDTGIININCRLKLMFSDKCGLFLSRSDFGGLKVTLRIPHGIRESRQHV